MNRIGADTGRSSSARGAVEVPGLRIGASVVIKAVRPERNGEWTVLLNGSRLTARVSGSLKSGAMYSARVESLPDRSGWFFRVLGAFGADHGSESPRFVPMALDALTALAVRALMSETLSLNSLNVSRMRTALSRREHSDERTELLARSLAKGLDPESMADALEAAISSSEAFGERNGSHGDGEGSGRNPDKEAEASPTPDTETAGERVTLEPASTTAPHRSTWREAPSKRGEGDNVRGLADLLRFLAVRSSEKPNPYQLFNSRGGPGGRWIYVPYRFAREGVAFSGTLRILIPEGSGQARLISADVLSEDDGENRRERYSFRVSREGDGYSLNLFSENPSVGKRLVEAAATLRRELEENHCSVDVEPLAFGGDPGSNYRSVDDHA